MPRDSQTNSYRLQLSHADPQLNEIEREGLDLLWDSKSEETYSNDAYDGSLVLRVQRVRNLYLLPWTLCSKDLNLCNRT